VLSEVLSQPVSTLQFSWGISTVHCNLHYRHTQCRFGNLGWSMGGWLYWMACWIIYNFSVSLNC